MQNKLNLSKKQLQVLYIAVHVLVWTLLFLLPFAFFNNPFNSNELVVNSVILIKALAIFYLNFLFLVPKLLLQKRIGVFFLSIIAVLLLNTLATNFERNFMPPPTNMDKEFDMPPLENRFGIMEGKQPPNEPWLEPKPVGAIKPFFDFRFIGQISLVLMLIGVGVSLKVTEEWFKSEKHKEEVKSEHLSTELAFLKSQINPHFLFNSLNSIYSLAYKKSDKAPEAIIQLSKIMRYIIDDAASTTVLLEKELDHLSDYIELQKLRLTEKTKLLFTVNNQSSNELIEPMLLVPFVENAFKHGVDSIKTSYITIKIEVENNQLIFKSTNTIARQKTETMEAESGIGLKNVIRRLELLYPHAHNLKIIEDAEIYSVILKLNLKSNELLNS